METKKEDKKPRVRFLGVQFKYLMGVVLSPSREGSPFGGLSGRWNGVWTGATPRGGPWDETFHPDG